ncbi:MAG: hypothetical protein APF76_13950 [Desulfitibacter sp. BRH_c19]|nr:MAG: hypothetical protein APF76_13950 [Desulfitibacter sp. BRH_c19]
MISVPALAALNVALVVFLIHSFITREQRFLNKRLKEVAGKNQENRKLLTRLSWIELLRLLSRFWVAKNRVKKVEKKLLQAGIPLKGEEFLTVISLIIIAVVILGAVVLQNIGLTILLVVICSILPKIVVESTLKKRLKLFDKQIGDALVIISNSMRAGFSFMQAMDMVSKEMPNPISGEFNRTLREISMGTPTHLALDNLTERVGSEDLGLVITAILIQRQVGGNLAEVLDNISDTIRERIRIAGEIRTLTAQGRISGMIIGSLPIALAVMIFLIDQNYILTLFREPIGLIAVGIGLTSQVIGFLLIQKVIKIEV